MRGLFAFVVAGIVLLTAQIGLAETSQDRKPPTIRHTPVVEAVEGKPIFVTAEIRDESGVFAPTVWYRGPGDEIYSSADLVLQSDKTYVATLPARGSLEYYIEAYDELGNGPTRHGEPEVPHRIQITDAPASSNTLVALSPTDSQSMAGMQKPATDTAAGTPTDSQSMAGMQKPAESVSVPGDAGGAPMMGLGLPPAGEIEKEPVVEAKAAPSPVVEPRLTAPPLPEAHPQRAVAARPIERNDPSADIQPTNGKPIYKKWWAIGAAGVVVAAGAGLLVYALMPDAVPQNVFTPTMQRP